MDNLQNLQNQLRQTLEANKALPEEEKELLLDSIELFNEEELSELIRNNTSK